MRRDEDKDLATAIAIGEIAEDQPAEENARQRCGADETDFDRG
jgi:hypothetical protein